MPDMQVITPSEPTELELVVESFARPLTQGQRLWTNEQAVAEQLAFHRLTGTASSVRIQPRPAD